MSPPKQFLAASHLPRAVKIKVLRIAQDTRTAGMIRARNPAAIHAMATSVGLDSALVRIRSIKDAVDVAVDAVVSLAVDLVVQRVDSDVDGIGTCYHM